MPPPTSASTWQSPAQFPIWQPRRPGRRAPRARRQLQRRRGADADRRRWRRCAGSDRTSRATRSCSAAYRDGRRALEGATTATCWPPRSGSRCASTAAARRCAKPHCWPATARGALLPLLGARAARCRPEAAADADRDRQRGARQQADQRRRGLGAALVGAGSAPARLRRLLRRADRAPDLRRRDGAAGRVRGLGQPRLLRRGGRAISDSKDGPALLCDGGREPSGLGLEELRDRAGGRRPARQHQRPPDDRAAPRRHRAPASTSISIPASPRSGTPTRRSTSASPGTTTTLTVGLNVGEPRLPDPDRGIDWIPTLPPVLLDQWPRRPRASAGCRASPRSRPGAAPTAGSRSAAATMGLKHHQFRRLIELPERVEGGGVRDRAGHPPWRRGRPRGAASARLGDRRSARGRRRRRRRSATTCAARGAEFSVAQGVYVEPRSGWFSDRTAAYLACGRPALVQDTGVGEHLPAGEGLLTFATLDEAVRRRAIGSPPTIRRTAAAARASPRSGSTPDRVLGRLLARDRTLGGERSRLARSCSAAWSPATPARAGRAGRCCSTCRAARARPRGASWSSR